MQVVIPLTGEGNRFVQAGYTQIKPLIKVDDWCMLDYVINIFDTANDEYVFIVRKDHLTNTNLKQVIEKWQLNQQIFAIAPHKLGPVYAVTQALDALKNIPTIISYCDYNMVWNYKQFKQEVSRHDGCVVCYTGFHPHLLHKENVYAGCKVNTEKKLIEIKEKYSFEANKTKGWHSTGTYYFKNKTILEQYHKFLLESQQTINGEYYTSMVYPKMLEDGLDIRVYDEVSHFCQWGTPKDFEEYCQWQKIFNTTNA
jgi:NDP-sugar pyrophosphorylase family protein